MMNIRNKKYFNKQELEEHIESTKLKERERFVRILKDNAEWSQSLIINNFVEDVIKEIYK